MKSDERWMSLHRSKVTPYRVKCARALRGRILDCGGGLGDYLPYLQGEIVLLDRTFETLQMVQHPRRIVGDAEHLPFSENSFDSVWACAVAQYVHMDTFVSEVTRVTRPGGRALILVPNAKSPWDIIKKMFGMETWWDQKGIVKHYTVEDIRRYGRVTGEIQFLPAERYLRHLPILGHTLMLDIEVAKK